MPNTPDVIPSEPAALRKFTVGLLAELKNRDLLIEKLRHQVAGQNTHRFGSKGEGIDQLQLRLEDEEVAEAAAAPAERIEQAVEGVKTKPKRKLSTNAFESSFNVMSGSDRTISTRNSTCGASLPYRPDGRPCGLGTTLPCARCAVAKRTAVAALTPNTRPAARHEWPAKT
jgi:hypothetical protein